MTWLDEFSKHDNDRQEWQDHLGQSNIFSIAVVLKQHSYKEEEPRPHALPDSFANVFSVSDSLNYILICSIVFLELDLAAVV